MEGSMKIKECVKQIERSFYLVKYLTENIKMKEMENATIERLDTELQEIRECCFELQKKYNRHIK